MGLGVTISPSALHTYITIAQYQACRFLDARPPSDKWDASFSFFKKRPLFFFLNLLHRQATYSIGRLLHTSKCARANATCKQRNAAMANYFCPSLLYLYSFPP